MSAFTRLGQYNIMAKASGPLSLDDIVIKLSSDPPQDENTFKRFLTLKTDDASLGDEAWRGLVDAGLQMTFLADVEDAIKDALGLDELRIYSGTVQNTIAFSADPDRANEVTGQDRRQYNVLLSRYFGRKLLIGYTTSLFDGEKAICMPGIGSHPGSTSGFPPTRTTTIGMGCSIGRGFKKGNSTRSQTRPQRGLETSTSKPLVRIKCRFDLLMAGKLMSERPVRSGLTSDQRAIRSKADAHMVSDGLLTKQDPTRVLLFFLHSRTGNLGP